MTYMDFAISRISYSISSVEFQIQLNPIANTIVLQSQLVPEGPFALSLDHDLVRISPNLMGYESFEVPYPNKIKSVLCFFKLDTIEKRGGVVAGSWLTY